MNNYRIKLVSAVIFSAAAIIFFLAEPQAILTGARNGLGICTVTVIPSLFPFTVLADYMVRSGLAAIWGRRLERAGKILFALPGSACTAIFAGFVGGFPVGARMTAQLLNEGSINKVQAKRMMMFCVCGGPAFVIGAVGTGMLGSDRAGLVLYASTVSASLVTGVLLRFFAKEKTKVKIKPAVIFNGGVFAESVSSAVNSMLSICGWIVLFSAVISLAARFVTDETALSLITIPLEVTSGCLAAAGKMPAYLLAGIIAWSGLGVHCQILPYLKRVGLPLRHFFAGRAINAAFATAIAWVLFKLFPCKVSVFATSTEVLPRIFSISAPAGIAMLFMASFMFLDLAKQEKM